MTQTRYRENINIYIISILFHQLYTVTRSLPFSNYYMSPLKWVPDFYHLTVKYPHRGGRIGQRFCAKIAPVRSFFNVLTLKRIFQMVSEDGASNTKQQVFILSLRCKPMQVLYSLSLLCWHPPPLLSQPLSEYMNLKHQQLVHGGGVAEGLCVWLCDTCPTYPTFH